MIESEKNVKFFVTTTVMKIRFRDRLRLLFGSRISLSTQYKARFGMNVKTGPELEISALGSSMQFVRSEGDVHKVQHPPEGMLAGPLPGAKGS